MYLWAYWKLGGELGYGTTQRCRQSHDPLPSSARWLYNSVSVNLTSHELCNSKNVESKCTSAEIDPAFTCNSIAVPTTLLTLPTWAGHGMAHQQSQSSNASGGPHAVSLKVLRLSRPSCGTQTPLPRTHFGNGLDISENASLAYPSADQQSTFALTPLLTLPASFGAAYVGETFACTLCANDEVRESGNRSVSGVRIVAELQTPSNPAGIELELGLADDVEDESGTMQRTLKHELEEEGPHVLAVTVSYTETSRSSEGGASGGRARSFRKLYQFVSQQLIAVRSKITETKRRGVEAGTQWVLEAQLENVGDAAAVLERIWLQERVGIRCKAVDGKTETVALVLKPQDVEQIMYVLDELEVGEETEAGRVPLAQMNIDWRSAMGERGHLTTGWLASRGR